MDPSKWRKRQGAIATPFHTCTTSHKTWQECTTQYALRNSWCVFLLIVKLICVAVFAWLQNIQLPVLLFRDNSSQCTIYFTYYSAYVETQVLDKDLKLAYHGQFDDSRPGRPGMPITGRDIKAALDSVVVGRPVDEPWKPSVGCSIKWN